MTPFFSDIVDGGQAPKYTCNYQRERDMNSDEFQSEVKESSIEDLRRKKAELENENSDLVVKLLEGETLKTKLQESRKDGRKLVHHREKLKNLKSKRQGTWHMLEDSRGHLKKGDDGSEVIEIDKRPTVDVSEAQREINALKLENSTLVKEKRKVEEQRDNLVQELAALNMKHDKLQAVCIRLESEINRLSSCVDKSKSEKTEQEEDIEVLKEQLRCFQADIKSLQTELRSSQRLNEQRKAELNEARMVIRDMRRQIPRVQVYPAAAAIAVEPVYRAYDDRYGREPTRYAMMRTYSGECLVPLRDENHRRGPAPSKKVFLTPDETAVVDEGYEVVDRSLASSKSI